MTQAGPGRAGMFCVTVKRNCSMSPGALGRFLIATLGLWSAIGLMFVSAGAWPVVVFFMVVAAGLTAAFYLQGRHAADYERLTVCDGRIAMETSVDEHVERREFNLAAVDIVEHEELRDFHVTLRAHDEEVELGRFFDEERRRELMTLLRTWPVRTRRRARAHVR